MNQKEKNMNVEVLRVLAMFLIVAGHYVWTGVKQVMNPNVFDVNTVYGGGKLCLYGTLVGVC